MTSKPKKAFTSTELEAQTDAILAEDAKLTAKQFRNRKIRNRTSCACVKLDAVFDETVNLSECIGFDDLDPFYVAQQESEDEIEELMALLPEYVLAMLGLLGSDGKTALKNMGSGFLSPRRQQQIIKECEQKIKTARAAGATLMQVAAVLVRHLGKYNLLGVLSKQDSLFDGEAA